MTRVVGAHAPRRSIGCANATDPKRGVQCSTVRSFTALLVLPSPCAVPATASGGHRPGAVVFSGSSEERAAIAKGGLFAAKDGHLNQLTEDPTDSEPDFSADGRTIAFVRGGDVYSVRADGSGQRKLTSGAEVDVGPHRSRPTASYVVFERRAPPKAAARPLPRQDLGGSASRADHRRRRRARSRRSRPTARAIVFVRSVAETGGGTADDIYSVRPSGAGLARLTTDRHIDEFAPRYFSGRHRLQPRRRAAKGRAPTPTSTRCAATAAKCSALVAGAGSAYVEDVAPAASTLLFRRDQGLWVKQIGPGRARKLASSPTAPTTNSVFSSDGRKVAAFIATEEAEIALGDRRRQPPPARARRRLRRLGKRLDRDDDRSGDHLAAGARL